jgi:hypothetical protein
MGCTSEELRSWLPGACRGAAIDWVPPDGARVRLEEQGVLTLQWIVQPSRRIALITLPRLQVNFDFGATEPVVRHRFMKHFDLYTQRGGG